MSTIADLFLRAAERYGDRPFGRIRPGDEWIEVSYADAAVAISEVGRGLVDLGVQPRDRVAVLGNTRIEWTYCQSGIAAAGATVVPIYPSNSPRECEWVLGDSGAVAVFCEDAEQAAKVQAVRGSLPALRHVILMTELDDLRQRGRGRDHGELLTRAEAVAPEDLFKLIYTSGTTGNPKGVELTHGGFRSMIDQVVASGTLNVDEGDTLYLFLPLAHAFAVLMQLITIDRGACVAFNAGGPTQVVAELAEVQPTHLPSVPRIFEKVYAAVAGHADPAALAEAVAVGGQVHDLRAAGEPVPDDLQAQLDAVDAELFAPARAIFGGRLQEGVTGAAPIAKEILEYFWAAGIPVLEGYGLTETSPAATLASVARHRFGSVGPALPKVQLHIADDGEILIKGPNLFRGYWNNPEATAEAKVDGWLHTGDLGHVDEDGFLFVTGRKKDIIITAGGKNLAPANMENDLKRSPWISQAVMHGDRRPYPVALITLDPEAVLPWAAERGKPQDPAALASDPDVRDLVQAAVDTANEHHAQVGRIKRFAILDRDLSQEDGELTPTLKVKRHVVEDKYASVLDALYEEAR